MPPAPSNDPAAADWVDRRVDALVNHERVIAAAIEVFAERGLEATVPEVAARAGVGKATVYRSYPTKADLVDAVTRHQLDWLAERVAAATRQPDAFTALRDLIGDMSEKLASDRVLVQILPHARQWRQEHLEGSSASSWTPPAAKDACAPTPPPRISRSSSAATPVSCSSSTSATPPSGAATPPWPSTPYAPDRPPGRARTRSGFRTRRSHRFGRRSVRSPRRASRLPGRRSRPCPR